MVRLVLIATSVFLLSCDGGTDKSRTAGSNESGPALKAWADSLADTLIAHHQEVEDTALLKVTARHLLDTSVLVPRELRWKGYISAFAERFRVYDLNGFNVVSIEYGRQPGYGPNEIVGHVLTADHRVLCERTFPGCHYHNGILDVVDLDRDGVDELRYTLIEPVQSVPVIATTVEYYTLVGDSLKRTFSIITDERRAGVAFKPGKGEWITRAYHYDTAHSCLVVSERVHEFEEDDFAFEGSIEPCTLLSESTYRYQYKTDSLRYKRVN